MWEWARSDQPLPVTRPQLLHLMASPGLWTQLLMMYSDGAARGVFVCVVLFLCSLEDEKCPHRGP